MKKKILQVPVIVGKGSAQFFIEKETQISPPSPPIYKIEQVDKKVIVVDACVIPGKILFNAYLWKNIVYKTVEDVCDGVVNGPLFHSTFKIPFGGFIEVDPIGCEEVKEGDIAELLEAFVEGEKTYLQGEGICKGEKVYCSVLEKDVVKLVYKVIRYEHIPVCYEDGEREDKCICKDEKKEDKKCVDNEKKDKYEDKCEKRYDCRGDYYAGCRGGKFYQS